METSYQLSFGSGAEMEPILTEKGNGEKHPKYSNLPAILTKNVRKWRSCNTCRAVNSIFIESLVQK